MVQYVDGDAIFVVRNHKKFLDKLSNYHLFKEDSEPKSLLSISISKF